MKPLAKGAAVIILFFCLAVPSGALADDSPSEDSCQEAVSLLKAQNDRLSGDLRRIQREIAALRADMDKPGLRDALGGIGFILGIFGTAAFVSSRRKA